uniref:Uncharacterized protein n=1 Tax=Heterorhabditis bacteriophora TaxID=37862 RepID=A0A1I7X8Y2_HETBA
MIIIRLSRLISQHMQYSNSDHSFYDSDSYELRRIKGGLLFLDKYGETNQELKKRSHNSKIAVLLIQVPCVIPNLCTPIKFIIIFKMLSNLPKQSLFLFFFTFQLPITLSITCYECTSSQGQDCKYSATSCQYGLFGCVKIAAYSGGVDKMGMFYNQDRRIISMIRGCAILPFGG